MAVLTNICHAAAQPADLFPEQFDWPEDQLPPIPDARLFQKIEEARESAREALGRAGEGQSAARLARRRENLRDFVGLGAKPVTIDAGTVMTATSYNGEYGPLIGMIEYPSEARMTGLIGPDVGHFKASGESVIDEFFGWVWGAQSASPEPAEGVFRFKNGESFTGETFNGGDTGRGIYASSDGERRFIGEIDFTGGYWRAKTGIVEDRNERLIAVVR